MMGVELKNQGMNILNISICGYDPAELGNEVW